MLRRLVSVVCILVVIFQITSVSATAQQNRSAGAPEQTTLPACKQPCLEDGTPIKLRIAQTVSSADAHVNDRVEFEVLEEVRISGVLIIPKGGIALGTVTEAQPKRRMARGGKLEIVMDSVRLTDGEKAALRATKGGNGGGHTGAMTAGIVATALVCIVCAPLFLLMHGKDITIPKGTEVPTFVDGNLPLNLAKFQQADSASQQGQENPIAAPANATGQENAEIEITSVPNGSDVDLDGIFVGNTPSTVGVSQGDHTIGVKKSGYKLWERKIKVTSGKVRITAELEADQTSTGAVATIPTKSEQPKDNIESVTPEHPVASPASAHETATPSTTESLGAVSFTSEPAGAEVYVDDSFAGKTPVVLHIKLGHHYAHMFAKDYKNWSQDFTVVAGSELKLAAKLEKTN
jgi:PEGA domain